MAKVSKDSVNYRKGTDKEALPLEVPSHHVAIGLACTSSSGIRQMHLWCNGNLIRARWIPCDEVASGNKAMAEHRLGDTSNMVQFNVQRIEANKR